MNTGKVKFFNEEKGFGFIIPDDNSSKDIFFHISGVKGQEVLKQDESVKYELTDGRRGPCATEVERV